MSFNVLKQKQFSLSILYDPSPDRHCEWNNTNTHILQNVGTNF